MPSTPSIPPPDRPFSPSPPRDNRHSASRPPSLLFATPSVGTVASSASMNLSGLPPTPSTYQTSSFHFTYDHLASSSSGKKVMVEGQQDGDHTRHPASYLGESEAEIDDTVESACWSPDRTRRGSTSTTSSASPPLGATSLLSAIADINMPARDARFSRHGRSDSDPASPMTPRHEAPDSPGSFQSDRSHSSNASNLPASKSFPRLHQPTVIRRGSGASLAFIPSPVQVTPTSSSFVHHHRQTSMGAIDKVSKRSRTASVRSLEQLSHGAAFRANSPEKPTQSRRRDAPVQDAANHAIVTDENRTALPDATPDSKPTVPAHPPYSADNVEILHEIEDSPAPPGPLEHPAQDEQVITIPKHGKVPIGDSNGVCSPIDEPLEPEEPTHIHNDVDEIELNEVTPDRQGQALSPPPCTGIVTDNESFPMASTYFEEASDISGVFLPYTSRDGSRGVAPSLPHKKVSRAISFYAGFGRSSLPLPQLSSYRLELCLLWGDAHIFRWLPGRHYIPDWNLKFVGGHPQDPIVFDVRVTARVVVARLPVVWRFAKWI